MLTVDALGEGGPRVWRLTGDATDPDWTSELLTDYRPALYVVTRQGMERADPPAATCRDALADLRPTLAAHPAVHRVTVERNRPGFRMSAQPVCRVELDRRERLRAVAQYVERQGPPGQTPYRTFDVDFTPEFRVCLDTGLPARPSRTPTVLELELPRTAAADADLTGLRVSPRVRADPTLSAENGDSLVPAGETTADVLATVRERLAADPDILLVDRGRIVPLLAETATDHGVDLGLARVPAGRSGKQVPASQQLAGASTFESYGQRHHSPARYTVPGRVVVDTSNTFFLAETNLAGCLDLVDRSQKPLQELAWASIGNVLTAIQIRAARERDVLVQWRAWRPERFKSARTLHASDRGGTTLSPVVGVHEDVHELDFASLYPNIICEHNLSPETVRCRCHDDAAVPELDYTVCPEDGYLPAVLEPIVDDRADIKARLAEERLSAAERTALEGQSSALKWILVSCFGYQGFSNAKFGRIEVHEAINAYARDILLTAKERLEQAGWRVLHGIVDSIWVTPREGATQRPLAEVAAAITDAVGIPLEYESAFEWVAFCPRRDGDAGALTRYFGRRADPVEDGDRYKIRGLECRQRSTCPWVADVQRDLLRVFDETRSPAAVENRLTERCRALRQGAVDPQELLVTTRASKAADAYTRRTRTVAALERAAACGLDPQPGQSLSYLVRDDSLDSQARVRLAHEVDSGTEYDVGFYEERARRAKESISDVVATPDGHGGG